MAKTIIIYIQFTVIAMCIYDVLANGVSLNRQEEVDITALIIKLLIFFRVESLYDGRKG